MFYFLFLSGYQDSQLTLHISEDATSIRLKAFERTIINVTQARHVRLTSSTAVTVMCIVNLTIGIDNNTVSSFPRKEAIYSLLMLCDQALAINMNDRYVVIHARCSISSHS
jgi:hypothetical protein